MKSLALLCNFVLFVFTCVVLATDGVPKQAHYVILTLLLMAIPVFSGFVIFRDHDGTGWGSLREKGNAVDAPPSAHSKKITIEHVAAICNLVLLGLVCWAIVDQYPHPKEDGVFVFMVLTVLTPIVSVVVLLRSGWSAQQAR